MISRRLHLCGSQMKTLLSVSARPVFTGRRDKTPGRFCLIGSSACSPSGPGPPFCVASRALPFPRKTFRGATGAGAPRCYSGGVGSLRSFLRLTSSQRHCSVARATLRLRLAHPFGTDGTAKSHVVTLFLFIGHNSESDPFSIFIWGLFVLKIHVNPSLDISRANSI